MEVIKVVGTKGGKLVSTFAEGKWQKEYAEGLETKPDVGCLFAYSSSNMTEAKRNFGTTVEWQYWLAEAEVVGRVRDTSLTVLSRRWTSFWGKLKLRLEVQGAEYLLCSSITLLKRLT